ncbi:hypothetical protein LY76DRAFT_206670 [Colletotrichum caudatum]|nr:hypothetical protein LY76DRAFT_206670 [Colletotrichum caudatum]
MKLLTRTSPVILTLDIAFIVISVLNPILHPIFNPILDPVYPTQTTATECEAISHRAYHVAGVRNRCDDGFEERIREGTNSIKHLISPLNQHSSHPMTNPFSVPDKGRYCQRTSPQLSNRMPALALPSRERGDPNLVLEDCFFYFANCVPPPPGDWDMHRILIPQIPNPHPTQSSSSASTKPHPSVLISVSTSPATLLSTSSISRVQNTRTRPLSLIRASLSRTICTAAVSSSASPSRPSAPASAFPNPSRTSLSTSGPTAASTWPRISSANRPRSNSKLSCTPCATRPRISSRSRIRAASGLVHAPLRIRTSPSLSTLRLETPDDGGDDEHDDDDVDSDGAGLVSISMTRIRVTVRLLSGVRKAEGTGSGEDSPSTPKTGVPGRR